MSTSFELVDLIDLVITIATMELVLLVIYRHVTGRGIAMRDFVANMLAGLSLMFALRSVAVDSGTVVMGMWLMVAGAAHGTDILMRWRHSAGLRHPSGANA